MKLTFFFVTSEILGLTFCDFFSRKVNFLFLYFFCFVDVGFEPQGV